MTNVEEFCPRLPGEAEADWLERVNREIADTKLIADLLEIAASPGGVTEAERAELRERIQSIQSEADRARAMEMLASEPTRTLGARGH